MDSDFKSQNEKPIMANCLEVLEKGEIIMPFFKKMKMNECVCGCLFCASNQSWVQSLFSYTMRLSAL